MTVLGLDVGGANLKAATPDRRAVSVPFALWKQPDRLPAALAGLMAQFPDADELAVTMTGELCDCFETKRDGVNAILTAVQNVSRSRRVRVWSTDGTFVDTEEARRNHLKVAAANWHALATFAGQYVPKGRAILLDIGSTTTDIIPILDGIPVPEGKTDYDRIFTRELLYTGVRRTPVCAILGWQGAAEFFATTLDVYLMLGMIPEDATNTDTADGRPATRAHARARLARMYCGDVDAVSEENIVSLAEGIAQQQRERIGYCMSIVRPRLERMTSVYPPDMSHPRIKRAIAEDFLLKPLIDKHGPEHPAVASRVAKIASSIVDYVVSGSGEFLARSFVGHSPDSVGISLTDRLGPAVSACAPAYAVAVLAHEQSKRAGERGARA